MAAVRGYAIWKVKEGVELNYDNLTYFCPGGYTFTHKNGSNISFDFLELASDFIKDNRYIESDLRDLDEFFITESLDDKDKHLACDNYSIEFFKDGKIDFNNGHDEMCCCIDVKVDKEIISEAKVDDYLEPVYMAVYNPYNSNNNGDFIENLEFDDGSNCVELFNKLSDEEYELLIEE